MNHTELTNQGQASADGGVRSAEAKADNCEIPEKGQKGLKGRKGRTLQLATGLSNRGRGRSLQTATKGRGGLEVERVELVEVLEGLGVSVAGFDGLRCDSYEKNLAGRSLVELGAFYRRLLNPSEGYDTIQKQCVPWGEPSKYCGKLPSVKTLTEIKERLQVERAVRERLKAKKLIKARKKGAAEDEGEEYFREAVEMLAEELLAAKVEGKPISENLKLMDRLLRAASLRVRERREAREEAKLEWIQAGRPILEPDAEGGAPVEPKREITAEEMIERIYGPNPFNPDGSWKDGYPLPVCDNDHEKEWAEIKHLKVGDLAPDTVVRTFAGERVVLSDYRGKYVLLDFWATWAGPTWAEREELKKIHEAYGKDERLVMLSLSLDHDAKVARDDIQKRGYEWTQCLLGNWKHDRVTRAWGVEGIPAIYLIGPEGKIVAADLRGKKIRAAVDASLISAESGMRADDRQQSGNEVINRETGETGAAKGEKETVLRELREGDKQPETKADNGEIHQTGEQQAGLVELVSPVEGKTAVAKVDTRPEWAKRAWNKLIGGRSAKHPKGIWRCDDTGLPVDVATGKPVEDVDWTTLIGFGGDGEKPLN